MDLSLSEAAALLGRSPRAVRSRIARGELKARKVGKRWTLSLHELPLTDTQRTAMQQRIATAEAALRAVQPAALATNRKTDRPRSIRDFVAFTALRRLTRDLRARVTSGDQSLRPAARLLRSAMLSLAAAEQEFDGQRRRAVLLQARADIGRAIGALLADGDEALVLAWCDELETAVLRPIGGLLRWTERRLHGSPGPRGASGEHGVRREHGWAAP